MSGHGSATPPPAEGGGGDGGGWVYSGLLLFVAALLVIGYLKYHKSDKKQDKPAEAETAAPVADSHHVLVPRVDHLTPVCDSINYAYELDTQGDSISLTFPRVVGGDTTVKYFGHGEMTPLPPHTRAPGLVCAASLTPNKEARLRIWQVVRVRSR